MKGKPKKEVEMSIIDAQFDKDGSVVKDLTMFKSGHVYRGSAMETADNCGNCDGAACHMCRPIYEVAVYAPPVATPTIFGWDEIEQKRISYKRYHSLENAKKYYESL